MQAFSATVPPSLTPQKCNHPRFDPAKYCNLQRPEMHSDPKRPAPKPQHRSASPHKYRQPRSGPVPVFKQQADSAATRTTLCQRQRTCLCSQWRQTVAAHRKSHCVPSVSHEHSQPVRQCAQVPHFDFNDSAPHIGSPTFRCISR